MDNQTPQVQSSDRSINYDNVSNTGSDVTKNIMIVLLVLLLTFSILGVNILTYSGNLLQNILDFFNPVVKQTLSDLGYASGTVIDRSAYLAGDATKVGVDILTGSLQNVGDLLITASGKGETSRNIDMALNSGPSILKKTDPLPSRTTNPIQSSSPSSKSQWCLVGEYQDKRGCIEVGEQDKCISGQVFPNQKMCLNPTLSQNKHLQK